MAEQVEKDGSIYAGMKMNGAEKGGRLNGVNLGSSFFCILDLGGFEGVLSPSSWFSGGGNGDNCPSSLFDGVGLSSFCFSGIAFRKRMACGFTDIMSPGARRVFAFWCYVNDHRSISCISSLHGGTASTHLFTIKQNISVNDEAPSLVNAMSKTAPEYEDVNPSLNLGKHQASNRRQSFQTFLLLLFQLLLSLVLPHGKSVQGCRIISCDLPAGSNIG